MKYIYNSNFINYFDDYGWRDVIFFINTIYFKNI